MRLDIQEPLPPLDDTVTTCAYRIVQEALINAMRHASASRIVVSVGADAGELVVRIEDNGVGLSGAWEQPGHYGVRGMRERAAALGGVFDLRAGEHGGTQVVVRLPLSAAHA